MRLESNRAYRVFLLMEVGYAILLTLIYTCVSIYYIQVVGMSPLQLILVGTALEIAAFLFEVPTGVVADSYSRRRSVIIGTLLIGGAFFVEGLIPVFGAIIITQIVRGIGHTFISGAQQAWITDEIGPENAGKAFLRASQLGQIGGVIGVILAMIIGSINLQLGVTLGGGLVFLLGLILVAIMPETAFKPTPRGEQTTAQHMLGTFGNGLRIARSSRTVLILIASALVMGAFSESYDRLNELHFLVTIGLPGGLSPVVWFGLLSLITMPISLAITEFVRRRLDLNQPGVPAKALIVFEGLMIVGGVIFALAGNLLVAVLGATLLGLMRGLAGPVHLTWLNQSIESSTRATVISIYSQANALGQIAGGPVLGLVGNYSVRAALAVGALLLSPDLLLYWRSLRHTPAADAADDAAPASPAAV